jgi:hypothetical protein
VGAKPPLSVFLPLSGLGLPRQETHNVAMWTRTPLLALLVENPEYQTRKFFQKREITQNDAARFRERVGVTGRKLIQRLTYDKTPGHLVYPSASEAGKMNNKAKGPSFFAKVPDEQRKPMARSLRLMRRVGIAAGGRHDGGAAKIGYYRMSFHPDDDKHHGNVAGQRTRMVKNHILKHFPDMSIDHFKDTLADGRHTHHLEIAHNVIPNAIKHLRAWREVLDDVAVLTSAG